jgi:succinate dehydrogenase / fumarate reductase iron-sulfur subunit
MRINGKEGLACKTLVKDVVAKDGDTVTVEPLNHLPVQRDLIVNQDNFFKKYRAVQPFLMNDEKVDRQERLQSPEDRLEFDDTTNCILCAACYSACPVLDKKLDFIGPAASIQAFRFIADSRDRGQKERLQMLHTSDGVWACDNHFKCTQCCPRSILITNRINQTKEMIKKWKKINT